MSCPIMIRYSLFLSLLFPALVYANEMYLLSNISPILRPSWNVTTFSDISRVVDINPAEILQGRCLVSIGVLPSQENAQSSPWYSGIWLQKTCARFALLGPLAFEIPPGDRTNLTELLTKIAAYKERGFVPTQFVVARASNGRPSYAAYMEFARNVQFRVWTPKNRAEADGQYEAFVQRGFRIKALTGFERDSSTAILAVWVKPDLSSVMQRVHYGLPLTECLLTDKHYQKIGFIPVLFQVYSVEGKPYCVGIWECCHRGYNYAIKTDTNLQRLIQSMLHKPSFLPRQLSAYSDSAGKVRYFGLFSEYSPPAYPALWENRAIPKSYLPGSTEGFSSDDLERIDRVMHAKMRYFHIPAALIAVVREEKLKIAIAYGYANHATLEKVTWNTRMRIGSISKTLTAVGLFTLIQEGRLSLEQKLWGNGSLFGTEYGRQPYKPNMLAMTVRDLLAHTEGGWSGRENDGWPDPTEIMIENTDDELISYVVDTFPLPYKPGTHWQYCNFGYVLIGKLIEKISGMPYKRFMHERIVDRYAMKSMELTPGYSLLPDEAMYMNTGFMDSFGPGMPRNWPDGGWVATPADLLRFSTRVDGFPLRVDILNATTLAAMTEPSPASNGTDSQGWTLNHGPGNDAPVWWRGWQHSGKTQGSSGNLARGNDGLQLAYIQSGGYTNHLDDFMTVYDAAAAVSVWPDHDLFADS